MEKPGKHHLIQVINVNTPGDKSVDISPYGMWWKGHFISVVFFYKTCNPSLLLRKTSRPTQVERHSTKRLLSALQTVKVIKDKKRLRNCHRPEENRWWVSSMHCGALDSVLQQNTNTGRKTGETEKKFEFSLGIFSVDVSHSVMSDPLRPHGL